MHEIMRYIASSVREQYEANPEFESATQADKPKMPAVESQKSAAEDRQNEENINYNSGFIVLQTQLAFSLGSRSQKVILDSEVMHSSVFQESQIRTNVIKPFPKQNKTMSVSERVM